MNYVRIQGERVGSSTQWMFDDGNILTYTPWTNGQPDNTLGQNSLLININEHGWHDADVLRGWPYICEQSVN